MTIDDAKWLRGSKVIWRNRFKPWEEPDYETVTILSVTAKRVRILTEEDTVKLVRSTSLTEVE